MLILYLELKWLYENGLILKLAICGGHPTHLWERGGKILGFFGHPPYDTRKKFFCLRTALNSFDFSELFLYFLSMIGAGTIEIYYSTRVASLGLLVWSH